MANKMEAKKAACDKKNKQRQARHNRAIYRWEAVTRYKADRKRLEDEASRKCLKDEAAQ
jgi:hypothetical protein